MTAEWKNRKVNEGKEFAILTDEISRATFGRSVIEYREFKGLEKQQLRDHMTGLELIFTMLGEASTTHIERGKDAQSFDENKQAAREGGTVAGIAKNELEKRSRLKVSTPGNYLAVPESRKQLDRKK